MTPDEIEETVFSLLERNDPLPVSSRKERLDYRYLDAGHIDSFAILNLIVALEATFDVTLSPEDTQSDEFRTPGGIIKIIAQQLTAKADG